MAHHGDSRLLREINDAVERMNLGPTGEFPRGKIVPSDKGEIRVAIAADPETGTVIIDFGAPTAWIGFTPEQCEAIEASLYNARMKLRGIEE